MKNVAVLIKPSSSNCNMRCSYCFYYDVADNRTHESFGMMNDETMRSLIEKVLSFSEQSVSFNFQGGEPTLVGVDYYRKFIALVNSIKGDKHIYYSIQTNGILLDDEFCTLFKKNNFLVGLSMDGPKDVHNLHRLDASDKGTFKQVDDASKLLRKHGVPFNILSVVTKNSVRRVNKIYNYFMNMKYDYLQFIPCIHEFNDKEAKQYYLSPKDYGEFLVKLFKLWYKDLLAGKRLSIRMFDNYLQIMSGLRPESCDMNGFCTVNLVAEADGSIYPCDFYVLDEWKIGNVNTDDIADMYSHPNAVRFVEAGSDVNPKCKACKYISLCRGGCRRHKEMNDFNLKGENQVNSDNYFCESYLHFFDECINELQHINYLLRTRQI